MDGCFGPRAVTYALKGSRLSHNKRLLLLLHGADLLERYLLRFNWFVGSLVY